MQMTTATTAYPWQGRLIHLGLAGFGIAAWLTGELAEEGGRSGYLLHAYCPEPTTLSPQLQAAHTAWLAGIDRFQNRVGGKGRGNKNRKASSANPSPVTDGSLVYAYFKSGDLARDPGNRKIFRVP